MRGGRKWDRIIRERILSICSVLRIPAFWCLSLPGLDQRLVSVLSMMEQGWTGSSANTSLQCLAPYGFQLTEIARRSIR